VSTAALSPPRRRDKADERTGVKSADTLDTLLREAQAALKSQVGAQRLTFNIPVNDCVPAVGEITLVHGNTIAVAYPCIQEYWCNEVISILLVL
jgi:hypothetical protein